MRVLSISATFTIFVALVTSQRLTKPPLQPNLDNLKQGLLDNLHPTHSTRDPFQAGYIPSDCKKIVEREKFNPASIRIWNVHYDDCSAPWIICYHKNSNGSLDDLIDRFGRLPVHTRQYVRHVVSLPAAGGSAYNDGGNIAFFGTTLSNINVHVHESAHSLDLLGAYKDKPLSSSTNWINNYNQDADVPDPYAQTNQIENVAQNTVVDTYQRNVPGGFSGLNPNANKIFHQYATVDTEQREAGNLLIPGGTCTGRLANSSPVPVSGAASRVKAAEVPNVALPAGLQTITKVDFNTKDSCQAAFDSEDAGH
ncbi:MAG: hypothetical protein Q9167_004165 [Letrouitia subvulpina]